LSTRYWISSVEAEDFNDNGDLAKAVISTHNHRECVVVYGSNEKLTERVVKILEGLNREAEIEI